MKLKRCLACGGKNLFQVLDLGKQPLANNYGETKRYPLVLNACKDCDHAQLSISVSPDKLFKHYLYESGTSNTLREWFKKFAQERVNGDVLDIASNDGTFLKYCRRYGHKVQGIDPAENLTPKSIPTRVEFFGEDTKFDKQFDTITAFNVVAHTPNPLSIMRGIRSNLAPTGTAYVMCSQGAQFQTGQFDTIYHEHHSYYSIRSMAALANRAGLHITGITVEPIHGGSLLFELRKLNEINFERYRDTVNDTIAEVKEFYPKNKLVAFGAAAKGVVFINATGLKPEYVVDEAEIKWGHKIPGTNIPIVSPDALKEPGDLTIVILAWNFADEIVAKIKKVRPKHNDQFVRFF